MGKFDYLIPAEDWTLNVDDMGLQQRIGTHVFNNLSRGLVIMILPSAHHRSCQPNQVQGLKLFAFPRMVGVVGRN